MSPSQVLAYLSLAGFIASFGYVIHRTRQQRKNSWDFTDHGLERLPDVLGFALRSCLNEGSVIIEDPLSERFIQFKKYIHRDRTYGLEMGFPDATWSKDYCEAFRAKLRAGEIPFREDFVNVGEVKSFVLVNCAQDLHIAEELSRFCLLELFGLRPDCRLKSTVNDHSIFPDTIDDPDFTDPSFGNSWSRYRANEKAKDKADPAMAFSIIGANLGLHICFPVLWCLAFFSDAGDSEWDISFLSLTLTGRDNTAIAFVIYCFFYIWMFRLSRKFWAGQEPDEYPPIARLMGRIAWRGLPLAVVLSWMGW